MTRFRHPLKVGESRRVNAELIGTHEFNASLLDPQRINFWETNRNVLSPRRGSFGHDVVVLVRVGHQEINSTGRVSERRRRRGKDLLVTELRFRPMTRPDARKAYSGVQWSPKSIAVVTKSRRRGIDYEYEVVAPNDARWAKLRLLPDERERYG